MGCLHTKNNIYEKQHDYGTSLFYDLSHDELNELRQVVELYSLIYNNLADNLNSMINFNQAIHFYIKLNTLDVKSDYINYIKNKYIYISHININKIKHRYGFNNILIPNIKIDY